MEDKTIIEFFPNSTFKGSQFCFYCPNMAQKDKISISELIKEYEGVRILFNLINFISQFPLLLIKTQLS